MKRSAKDEDKPRKKAKVVVEDLDEEEFVSKTYTERLIGLSPIAEPLADEKLTKKLYKLVKKASAAKVVRRGVKEVVKAIRKGGTGLCVIAGDISPVEVICHVPVLCEESEVKYVFVPSKQDLGMAASSKRPTSCILVLNDDFEHRSLLEKCMAKLK